jgi:Inner membrane component of T3SS, cytoplasmic domain
MIECSACHTLNPNAQAECLVCGASLASRARNAAEASHRCSAGHPIDSTWKSCPYCDRRLSAELGASHRSTSQREEFRNRTAGEAGGSGAALRQPAALPAVPRPTRIERADAGPRRRTVLAGVPTAAEPSASMPPSSIDGAKVGNSPAGGVTETRQIVGVLAAPELGSGGKVFPVRAGKNTIGSDQRADICLEGDPSVSEEHAMLLFRGGIFMLADRLSTNGTWVNGQEVSGTIPAELRDRDRIRCGQVELTLLMISISPSGLLRSTPIPNQG